MIRRLAACVALIALVAGACGSTTPVLTDPKEIVAQSVATLQTMKSFHLHATASGTIKIDLLGTGNALPVDLQGTTADGLTDGITTLGSGLGADRLAPGIRLSRSASASFLYLAPSRLTL